MLLTAVFGGVSLAAPQAWGELDSSWVLGLVWWFQHKAAGGAVFFTYGPLGWLTEAVGYARPEAALALVFLFVTTAAVAFLVIVGLREHVGWVGAVIGAAVVVRVSVPEAETLGTVTVLGCLLLVRSGRTYRALPVALGAWAAFVVLIKPGTGLVCLVCAVVMSVHRGERLRSVAVTALSALLTTTVGWLVLGQPLTVLFPWLYASTQLMSGYWIMMYENPALHSQYWTLLVLAAVFVVAVARRSDTRWRSLALFLPFAFLMFKHGFVRHAGEGNSAIASVTAVMVGCLGRPSRTKVMRIVAPLGLAVVAVLAADANQLRWPAFEPTLGGVRVLGDSMWTVTSSSRWQREWKTDVAAVSAASALSPAMAAQVSGGTQVDPWALWALWPNVARWQPVPTFQQYSAYTPWLDQRNASELNGSHAPTSILRKFTGDIDGRYLLFDAPAYQSAVVCHYAVTSSDGVWQLLRRSAVSRCGSEVLLATEPVAQGTPIAVPAPRGVGDVVVARFRTSTRLTYRLRTIAFKPSVAPEIAIDGVAYRLVLDTLDDTMLVRLPASAPSLQAGGGGLTMHTLELVHAPVSGTVSFYEIPYH